MRELIFNVTEEDDGGFVAIAEGAPIATQGDTWQERREMVLDAARGYFYDSLPPDTVGLLWKKTEIITLSSANGAPSYQHGASPHEIEQDK